MNALIAVTTQVLLLLAAASAALSWRSRPARLAALGVIWFGGLSLVMQALGGVAAAGGTGVLTPRNTLLGAGAVCVAAWIVRRLATGSWLPPAEAGFQGWLPSVRAAPRRASLAPLAIAVGAGLVFLSFAAATALSAPPRGWDVLSYHLPRAASWLLHGGFNAYGGTGAFYPGNAEFLILSTLFTGSDRLVPLTQLPFAGLAAAALYGLARLLGGSRRAAAVPVAVLLLSPLLFFQATLAKDDLVVTALVLAAGLFALRSLPDGERGKPGVPDVIVAGLALGLAVGTKYSILPFAVLSIPVFFAIHLAARPHGGAGSRLRSAGAAVSLFAAAMAVPSAFWFIRNAIMTGSPLAPLPTSLSEWTRSVDLKQQAYFVPSERAWLVFPWLDRHMRSTYSGGAGYGAAFGAVFLPALVLCAVRMFDSRNDRIARVRLMGFLALIVSCVAAWWIGRHHLPRFLWPAAALAIAGAGALFRSVTPGARRVMTAVLIAGLAFSCAETFRIAFRGDDITWSHRGGVSREEFYQIPRAVHRFPTGTKILLVKPTGHDFYATYRYPLIGVPPGNDVVMEADVGLGIDVSSEGVLEIYPELRAAGVEYVFMRFFGKSENPTPFDAYPSLYPKLIDTVQMSYPWYRESFAYTPEGEYLGPGFVTTKLYQVARRGPDDG